MMQDEISSPFQNYHTYCVVNKFFGQLDDGLYTGPKHVAVYYILLLIVVLLCSRLYVYIDIYTLQLCITDSHMFTNQYYPHIQMW